MARLKIEKMGSGQHPSEVLIGVNTSHGRETLIVDNRSVRNDDSIDVGYPVGRQGGYLLVELPRETSTGEWRVLVPESSVSLEEAAA